MLMGTPRGLVRGDGAGRRRQKRRELQSDARDGGRESLEASRERPTTRVGVVPQPEPASAEKEAGFGARERFGSEKSDQCRLRDSGALPGVGRAGGGLGSIARRFVVDVEKKRERKALLTLARPRVLRAVEGTDVEVERRPRLVRFANATAVAEEGPACARVALTQKRGGDEGTAQAGNAEASAASSRLRAGAGRHPNPRARRRKAP